MGDEQEARGAQERSPWAAPGPDAAPPAEQVARPPRAEQDARASQAPSPWQSQAPQPAGPAPPGYGQRPPSYGQAPPGYGQGPSPYGRQAPPPYGQQAAPSYGQAPPLYGQQPPPGAWPAGPWGPLPPQQQRRGVPGWAWALGALGLSLLLVLSVLTVVLVTDDDGSPSAGAASGADGTAVDASALTDLVPELSAFVEEESGLEFLEDVEVTLLDDEEFVARLQDEEPTAEEREDLEGTGATLEALGLVPVGTDVQAALDELLSAGVVGFYDPATDELVVRGVGDGPTERVTLVHELTHALQDQHYDLDRDFEDSDDESGFGLTALAEGDATLVEDAYVSSLSGPDRAQYEEETSDVDIPDVPFALLALIAEPYVAGPPLVSALRDEGGTERVGEAFRSPPTTSEQVLFPETYLDGEDAVEVAAPQADGDVVDDGVLGASGVGLLLGDEEAARGWGGDRYVTWTAGTRTCTRVAYVGDTPEETAEVVDLVDQVAAPGSGVEVEADGTDGSPASLLFCVSDGSI